MDPAPSETLPRAPVLLVIAGPAGSGKTTLCERMVREVPGVSRVVTATTQVAVGAYNPLTMNGTIVVDGEIASAHSDWFLDGIVSAQAQAQIYQAVLAPVRVAYQVLGPARMTTITESWGVVDFVRTATTPGGSTSGLGWAVLALALLASGGLVVVRKRRRPAVR